jgi:flagellar biosynthesis/type III secretory pathway protein FliH
MVKKYYNDASKKWMLPEHALSVKTNISQNYPKVALTKSQKEVVDKITKEHQERGYAEGKRLGLQEMLNQKKSLADLMSSFSEYKKKCDQVLETQVVQIIEQICQGVLSDALSDQYQLEKLVTEVIESFKNHQQNFTIKANASTVKILENITVPDISTKIQIDNKFGDYEFTVENLEQVTCFSISDAVSAYIKKQ